MEFQNTLTNIIKQITELKNKVASLEEQLDQCIVPIQFKNYYYNNYPNKDRHILSESKIMVNMNNEFGLNLFNKIMVDMEDTNLYFTAKQQTMRLFKDMEYMDNDFFDFVNNNNSDIVVVPKNKVIKVWQDPQHINNNGFATIYYEGQYQANIFTHSIVTWMGSIEYVDDLPNKL
jgi:hypothetical protein